MFRALDFPCLSVSNFGIPFYVPELWKHKYRIKSGCCGALWALSLLGLKLAFRFIILLSTPCSASLHLALSDTCKTMLVISLDLDVLLESCFFCRLWPALNIWTRFHVRADDDPQASPEWGTAIRHGSPVPGNVRESSDFFCNDHQSEYEEDWWLACILTKWGEQCHGWLLLTSEASQELFFWAADIFCLINEIGEQVAFSVLLFWLERSRLITGLILESVTCFLERKAALYPKVLVTTEWFCCFRKQCVLTIIHHLSH